MNVKATKSKSGVFISASQGTQQGVLVDIVDLGMIEDKENNKVNHKLRFVYQITETVAKEELLQAAAEVGVEVDDKLLERVGQRKYVNSRPFNVKLALASSKYQTHLNKEVNAILGRKLTDEEMTQGEGFDLESLLGVNVMINVIYNEAEDGRVFANIGSIAPWPTKFGPYVEATPYVRVRDREQSQARAA